MVPVLRGADVAPWTFTPPPDSGVINVKDFGAKGDGVSDDTDAINRAISAGIDKNRYRANPFIWMPKGVYLVSGPIEGRVVGGGREVGKAFSAGWRSMLLLVGEDREKTIIRLADSTPGYGDPAKPRWVVATGSEHENRNNQSGAGNRAFRHAIMNLTVDVGRGNPGASAIDFIANNRGTISHVTLRAPQGSGHTAIVLTRAWPGPAFVFDVSIEGFARGINLGHYQYGMTFENIHMRGQREVGVLNPNNVVTMRLVDFEGDVPFYNGTAGHGMLVLLDSSLRGTGLAGGKPAISSAGLLNLRRVNVAGFSKAVDDTRKLNLDLALPGGKPIVSFDQGFIYKGSESAASLNLPIEDIPVARAPAGAVWVDGGKTAASLQAAIDQGAEYIYLTPVSATKVDQPVVLRNKVRWILGLSAVVTAPKGGTAFRMEAGSSPVVVLEQVYVDGDIVQASNRTLVLRHGDLGKGRLKATGPGKTHIVDVIGRNYEVGAQHTLWARQLNAEFGEEPLFTNAGTSWILGFKMETSPRGSKDAPKSTPSLVNKSGKLEVFGGLLYTLGSKADQAPLVPAFTNEKGSLSVSFRNNGRPETTYKTVLRQGPYNGGKDVPMTAIKGPGAALLVDQR